MLDFNVCVKLIVCLPLPTILTWASFTSVCTATGTLHPPSYKIRVQLNMKGFPCSYNVEMTWRMCVCGVPAVWGRLSQLCSAAQCQGHEGQTPSPECLYLWPEPPLPELPDNTHIVFYSKNTNRDIIWSAFRRVLSKGGIVPTCPTAYMQSSGPRIYQWKDKRDQL